MPFRSDLESGHKNTSYLFRYPIDFTKSTFLDDLFHEPVVIETSPSCNLLEHSVYHHRFFFTDFSAVCQCEVWLNPTRYARNQAYRSCGRHSCHRGIPERICPSVVIYASREIWESPLSAANSSETSRAACEISFINSSSRFNASVLSYGMTKDDLNNRIRPLTNRQH